MENGELLHICWQRSLGLVSRSFATDCPIPWRWRKMPEVRARLSCQFVMMWFNAVAMAQALRYSRYITRGFSWSQTDIRHIQM